MHIVVLDGHTLNIPANDAGCNAFVTINGLPSSFCTTSHALPVYMSEVICNNNAPPANAERDTVANLHWNFAHAGLTDDLQALFVNGTTGSPFPYSGRDVNGDDYNDIIGDPTVPKYAYRIVKPFFDRYSALTCQLARQHGAVCIDTYHAFNGPNGVRDAGPLLAPDHTHPNAKGHKLIAQLLVRAGYRPLFR